MTEIARHQSELSKKIDEYLDFLEFDVHSSPLTIRNYRHYLTRFSNYSSGKFSSPAVNNISKLLIETYKKYLSEFRLSSKTLGFHLIAIRGFLRWLRKKGVITLNLEEIQVPKVEGGRVDFLSGSDVERLFAAPDLGTIQGKRDRAIMELIYSTGLRVSELAALDRDSVSFIKQEIETFKDGRKKRSIFLSLRAITWIQNYLKFRKDKFSPLFIHHKGKSNGGSKMRLTVRSIQRMIEKYRKKIGLSMKVTPKTLRASFATDILMAGADVKSVQEMMGHKNISTTQIYAKISK